MELRQLRAFVAVAQEGTFTAAAARLDLVQSAVSATIRSLEAQLGVELFDRTTRRVALTDAGRALLPEALATLSAARQAADVVEQSKGGLRGSVSLGIMQAAAGSVASAPRLIADFQREHPLVDISVRNVSGSEGLADEVRTGRLDLAILSLPGDAAGLVLHELGRETMALAVPPTHPLAGRTAVSLAELAEEPFVDGPLGWGSRLANDRFFAATGASRALRFEVNDSQSIVEFVATGLAVALIPPSLAGPVPTVRFVPLEGDAPVFRTLLALPRIGRPRAAVAAFTELVRRTASRA